jgi:hypothetical protein
MSRVVAIHQPNYLPWLGLFHKIAHCDVFVFLDNVQYEKGGFTNRNKIKTSQGPKWLTVAVSTSGNYRQAVKDVRMSDTALWGTQHWTALQCAYAKAPCFGDFSQPLKSIYLRPWERLADVNEALTMEVCSMLGINGVEFRLASSMELSGARSELLAAVCREVRADVYLTGSGASRTYLQEEPFEDVGVKVVFDEFAHPRYRQLWGEFSPNMSVVDLLFNEGPGSLRILEANCGLKGNRTLAARDR